MKKAPEGCHYMWGNLYGRTTHPADPTGATFGPTHWPKPAPHETNIPSRGSAMKKSTSKWDDASKAAVLSEMATPIKEVKPCAKHFAEGATVKYRGDKCKVVSQSGNWVTIDCNGSVYKVYADILTAKNEKPAAPVDASKAAAQEKANAILDGCRTRAEYAKAMAAWPDMVEYVNELEFNAGHGMMKMRIANKLRAVLRKEK